jgi:replicative DNA helicase
MSLDLTVLRLLKYRERHQRLGKSIPARALDTRTQIILSDFGRYFREFPDAPRIDQGAFGMFFKMIHPTLKDDSLAVFDKLFKDMMEDVSPEIEAGLMPRLISTATAYDLAELIEKYNAGEEIDLRLGTEALMQQYDIQVNRKVKDPQILDAIEDLLKAEENDVGLHFRGKLDQTIKPLKGGDFVVLAARPDKGKTTWCADQLTYMAAQIDTVYPNENRSIMWFNNEGPGRRIVTRCFQAALNATTEELVRFSNDGTIRDQYRAALGGRGGALRIFDIHDMWNHEVEDLMRLHSPGLVLFDMVDNIRFGGDTNNNGQRTDQLLESMYQWARLMGVKYDCHIIATSQVSGDGDGLQWPSLGMLKDSKTGKQGAADAIIVLGATNEQGMEHHRYIGTTKNKLARTGVPGNPKLLQYIDGDRARFRESE